ncbi:MAG TPA: hypothetical protein VFE55_15530 [Acidimicrobiia bacterium]|nr:hypothetical protein [Acidimicrobiia bacterium]
MQNHVTRQHFHAGHNDAGYLPESDVEAFSTFEDAKSWQIQELLWAADNMASWADEHDCDDIPCPTYGDDCPEQLASAVTLSAEDLNLESGPEWQTYLSDGRALLVAWWIAPCQEDDCGPEDEDDCGPEDDEDDRYQYARDIAANWHGGQSSPLYAFASTGSIVAGVEAEIRDNLRLLRAGQYSAEEINAETPRLSALLDYVVSQTPELAKLPERYAVTATVARTVDGWSSVTQVPTFFLDANVQGIVSEAHAEEIARTILTAAAGVGATLHVSAVAL